MGRKPANSKSLALTATHTGSLDPTLASRPVPMAYTLARTTSTIAKIAPVDTITIEQAHLSSKQSVSPTRVDF